MQGSLAIADVVGFDSRCPVVMTQLVKTSHIIERYVYKKSEKRTDNHILKYVQGEDLNSFGTIL